MNGGETIHAIMLMSGSLDSQIAACMLREQGIGIQSVVFTSPFFTGEPARAAADRMGIPLREIDFTTRLVDVFEKCSALDDVMSNLCVECHAEMLRFATEWMEEAGCRFIGTGDVLNQRPATQSAEALRYIQEYTDKADCIVRPLSARLLPQSLPEREGWIDRDLLLDIEGDQRNRQQDLAARYGVPVPPDSPIPFPLTDPAFGDRLKDLRAHEGLGGKRALSLLRIGRHFRLGPVTKLVIGQSDKENAELERLAELYDLVLTVEDMPGPTGLLPIVATDDQIRLAASICAGYSDVAPDGVAPVRVRSTRESLRIEVHPASLDRIELVRV